MAKKERTRDTYDAVGEYQRRAQWSSYTNSWSGGSRGRFYWPFGEGRFRLVVKTILLAWLLVGLVMGALALVAFLVTRG